MPSANIITSTGTLQPQVREWYNRLMFEVFAPRLVHGRFFKEILMPKNSGDQPKFSKLLPIDHNVAPLTEAVAREAAEVIREDITGQLKYYGNHIEYSDMVTYVSEDPILSQLTKLISRNGGETLDKIYRDIMAGTTSIYRAGGVATRAEVTAKQTKLDYLKIVRALDNNNAQRWDKSPIIATDRVSTEGVEPSYFGIVDPYAKLDLINILGADFIPVRKYSKQEAAYPEEIGSFGGIRFLESTWATYYPAAGAAHVSGNKRTGSGADDVHTCMIIGEDALARTPLSGHTMEIIVKELGSAGTGDPYNMIGTIAWKVIMDAMIVNDDYMYAYEFCVSE